MQIIRVKGINGLGKTDGCEDAPVEVVRAIGEIGSNEYGRIIDSQKLYFEEIHLNNSNIEEAGKLIYENSKEIFSEQDRAIFIGGDHSISYGLVKGFSENFKNPFLIVFDAHADCMPAIKEPNHEEWLRKLVEEGFPTENIVLIGVRNIWEEEMRFLEGKGIQKIDASKIGENKELICDGIMEKARGCDGIYVSIDIDVLDPAFAPGAGYMEPGGMSSRDLIYFLHRLNFLKNLVGIDIVEINPQKDINKMTVKMGAKIVGEMLK
jgi:arginase